MKNVELAKKKRTKVTDAGWGSEIEIHNDDGYCGRILTVREGLQSSFHYHLNKNETFYVLSGDIQIELSFDLRTKTVNLHKGDCIDIPRFVAHRFTGVTDASVLEISTFDAGEDDIVRLESGDNQIKEAWYGSDDEFIAWESKVNRILGK